MRSCSAGRRGADEGATSVEYAIMAGFIAAAIVGAVALLGTSLLPPYQQVTNGLDGVVGTAPSAEPGPPEEAGPPPEPPGEGTVPGPVPCPAPGGPGWTPPGHGGSPPGHC
jgi:Flp pilus assembly pilin Flp